MGNFHQDVHKYAYTESPDSPNSTRWSLGDEAACGLRAYMRPCQLQDRSAAVDGSHPLASVCQTDHEMVFVVEDDDALREGIAETVQNLGFSVSAHSNASKLLDLLAQYKTGCVILDIRLPGLDGVAVQEWINRSSAALPVVFISGIQDVVTAVHCMKAGAFDFLQKPFGEMALRSAINAAVGSSRRNYCRRQSEELAQSMIALLTPTELHVARMISKGYPTKMIAAEMARSENTVKIHRHRIFTKLKVNSAASVANITRHAEEV
ncbi:response regulator [Novosphingobium sp.]|uniref:response regulator transcription factor n=1 Tax=Novosphingobium sp. TaxID=1874826 RepID=UPI00262AFF8F|nr:response regulator [Novosphingobium sp.]